MKINKIVMQPTRIVSSPRDAISVQTSTSQSPFWNWENLPDRTWNTHNTSQSFTTLSATQHI